MQTILVGKRGTVVIPAKLRKRYKIEDGSPMVIEERDGGIFMRPSVTNFPEVEIYTPERLAEFFLNNAMDEEDYLEARREVQAMGLNPDSIDHVRSFA
jgi:AbrB family looped-hinge helix DNA binding protein